MKHKIFFIALLAIAFRGAQAGAQNSAIELFNQASKQYENGSFAEAANTYESIVPLHGTNAMLLYNLGNCYYRSSRPGKAILNYEKALRLTPRDQDIRHNLSFVSQSLKEPEPSFSEAALEWVCGILNLNEVTALCSLFYIVMFALLTTYIIIRQRRFLWFGTFVFIPLILLSGLMALKIQREVLSRWAVVISGPSEARNGPRIENSVGFTLPEGRKVIILGEKDDWAAIGLPSEGLKGWIEKKNIEKI